MKKILTILLTFYSVLNFAQDCSFQYLKLDYWHMHDGPTTSYKFELIQENESIKFIDFDNDQKEVHQLKRSEENLVCNYLNRIKSISDSCYSDPEIMVGGIIYFKMQIDSTKYDIKGCYQTFEFSKQFYLDLKNGDQ